MYQILKTLLLVLLCLSLLSTCAFADDLTILEGQDFNTFGTLTASDYGVQTVSWSASFPFNLRYSTGNGTVAYSNHTFALSDSKTSDTQSVSTYYDRALCKVGTVVIPAGTLTVSFSTPVTNVTTSAGSGVSVSHSGSSFTVVSDGTVSPISLTISMNQSISSTSLSSYTVSASFTPVNPDPDPGPGPGPSDPGTPSGSMNGIQGNRYALSDAYIWDTYNEYIGIRKIMYHFQSQGSEGGTSWNSGEIQGEEMLYDMAFALDYNGYKWKIDPLTGDIVFDANNGARSGSWLDMVFRYLTYDYYWGTRLWSNDVSGSWYGSISDSFAYLNFRVNQIFDVLANDQDLEIKNATDEERTWVQNYFTGSGDKADSSKYDDLNNTGSAFKDAFAGAPDSSIADGFTAVNDNGYDFWSQEVSNDINGVSSSATSRAPAYVPAEQRIVDAYSDNWEQIVGGYYD